MEERRPIDYIYGLAATEKYKAEGVYNSTDECFVACRIAEADSFDRVICVCSPAQVFRKVLSYVQYGIYPEVWTFYCDSMFRSYTDEFFRAVPILLYGDFDAESKRLRAERQL